MRRQSRNIRPPKSTFQWPEIRLPGLNRYAWALLVLAVVLLLFNVFIAPQISKPREKKVSRARAVEIGLVVNDVFTQFDIRDAQIAVKDSVVSVKIADTFAFFGLYAALREKLAEIDAGVLDCRKTDAGAILMTVGENGIPVEKYLFVKSKKLTVRTGRAAIIIDDFGYSLNSLARDVLAMNVPLTISIIPGLRESAQTADIARLHNKEVIVHMPMEPLYEKYDDDGFTLVVGQDPGITSLRIRQAFAQLPMAIGMNNHQGSRATADAQLMHTVARTLKNLDKFFIDSRTNSKSIAYRIARQENLQCSYSSFFIDAKDDARFIRSQLELLAKRAKEEDGVIAIGHPRRRTVKALQEMIPNLEAMGVVFVPVSDLVH